MGFQIGESLTVTRVPGVSRVYGNTCSKVESHGDRIEWKLAVQGCPDFFIHDTWWGNGERDIVTAKPSHVPPMPKPLSLLLGKQRSTVRFLNKDVLVAVCLITPDAKGWPTRSFCSESDLYRTCGDLVDVLYARGLIEIATRETVLRDESRMRNRLCALIDPEAEAGPVSLYVVTHIVPTLKLVGWL